MSRITLLLTDWFPVADKVIRVVVAWNRIVLRREPVVEAVVAGLRLRRLVERTVKMPFADMAGRIACFPEQRGDGDLALPQVHGRIFGYPVSDADARGSAAGHQCRPRRRAVRMPRVAVGQPQPLGGEPIEVGRLNVLLAKAMQIPIAQIVGQDEDDVGTLGCWPQRRPKK